MCKVIIMQRKNATTRTFSLYVVPCPLDLEVLVNNKWLPVSASGNTDGLQQTSHKQTRLWFVLYPLKGTTSIVLCGGELHQLGHCSESLMMLNDNAILTYNMPIKTSLRKMMIDWYSDCTHMCT